MTMLTIFTTQENRRMKKLSLVLLAALLCFSCATTLRVEPESLNDTLVVGQVKLTVENWTDNQIVNLNGDYTTNIEIIIRNLSASEEQTVITRGNGVFYFRAVPGCRYEISHIGYEKSSNRGKVNIGVSPAIEFSIGSGKVFNVGKVVWTTDGATREHTLSLKNNFLEIRDIFFEKYSKSQWNDFQWDAAVLKG